MPAAVLVLFISDISEISDTDCYMLQGYTVFVSDSFHIMLDHILGIPVGILHC